MAKHVPVCITLTAEEVAEMKRMAVDNGTTISEWFGNQIRKAAKKKLPPRNNVGRPIATGMILLAMMTTAAHAQNVSPGGSTIGFRSPVVSPSHYTSNVTRYYNARGTYSGRSTWIRNTTRYYDSRGVYQGRAFTTNGMTRYYDSRGRYSGTKRGGL